MFHHKMVSLCAAGALVVGMAATATTSWAAGKTVYLKDHGTGNGSTAEQPVGTLSAALALLPDGDTLQIVDR